MAKKDISRGIKAGMPQDLTDLFKRLGRDGEWQNLWTADTDETIWFRAGEVPDLSLYRHLNSLYFSVNPQKNNMGRKQRGGIENVEAINALYADLDENKGWTQERIDALNPTPTRALRTGGGWQPLWILKEPVKVTDDNRAELNELQHAWVEYIGGDPGAQDISRVLRVPGSYNHKYDPPRQVVLEESDGPEYDIADLHQLVRPILEKKFTVNNQNVDVTADPTLQLSVIEALGKLKKRAIRELR